MLATVAGRVATVASDLATTAGRLFVAVGRPIIDASRPATVGHRLVIERGHAPTTQGSLVTVRSSVIIDERRRA
jgi:hypothetical protein